MFAKRTAGEKPEQRMVRKRRGGKTVPRQGKMKSDDTEVCHLSGRIGTVVLLIGFLNLSVNDGLTDRPTYTYR